LVVEGLPQVTNYYYYYCYYYYYSPALPQVPIVTK
jgi:hypothetical protein